MTKEEWYKQLFSRLNNSKFRSSFHLKQKDIDYINEKGMETASRFCEFKTGFFFLIAKCI